MKGGQHGAKLTSIPACTAPLLIERVRVSRTSPPQEYRHVLWSSYHVHSPIEFEIVSKL